MLVSCSVLAGSTGAVELLYGFLARLTRHQFEGPRPGDQVEIPAVTDPLPAHPVACRLQQELDGPVVDGALVVPARVGPFAPGALMTAPFGVRSMIRVDVFDWASDRTWILASCWISTT